MRISVLTLLAAMALGVAGCGSGPPPSVPDTPAAGAGTPAAAMASLLAALEDGDCDGVKAAVLDPAAIDCTSIAESRGSFAAEGLDVDQATYRTGEIVDDSVTVTVDWGGDSPEESFAAQRIGGAWKIIFDSAA